MKQFLHELFFENIPRKLVAILTAVVIFFFVNQSLTVTKTVNNVSIRIINVPTKKTVEGLLPNGYLSKKVSLTLNGKKSSLEEVSSADIEVVIDLAGKKESYTATITDKNLISLNSQIKIARDIRKVTSKPLKIQLLNLITDKVPVYLLKPSGEAPKGYLFVDIHPHMVFVEVTGPEEMIRKLKGQGLIKVFNLNEVSAEDLDGIASKAAKNDVVPYTIPLDQCFVYIPTIAPDKKFYFDPNSGKVKIDFLRTQLLPVEAKIPISYFIPSKHPKEIDISAISIQESPIVSNYNELKVLAPKVFAKNVSQPFLETVQSMMQIIVVPPILLGQRPSWSIEFISSKELEERYVSRMVQESTNTRQNDQPELVKRDLYRTRFRLYMNQLTLYQEDGSPLDFSIQFKGSKILLQPKSDAS
ncbi:MAG: CdaR family protein [Chlamydiia bacterium]